MLGHADRLRADGIDAAVDQYNTAPPEGWPLWCEPQIAAADVESAAEPVAGLVRQVEVAGRHLAGAAWEARVTSLNFRTNASGSGPSLDLF